MTNRLELNWKLDGFVDEQRYYCSETAIDIENPPPPKVVLDGSDRSYIDGDIDEDKNYNVCFSSVKNGIEKFSSIIQVSTFPNVPFQYVVSLLNFENGLVDVTGKRIWTSSDANVAKVVDTDYMWGSKALSILGTTLGKYIYTADSEDFWFGAQDFGIEASIRLSSNNNFHTILSQRADNGLAQSFCFYYFNGAINFEYSINGGSVITVSAPITLTTNIKYDVQCVREGASLKIAVNGIELIDHNVGMASLFNSNQPVVVGQLNSSLQGGYLNGYIDEIRVTKGFAPPIKAKSRAFPTS